MQALINGTSTVYTKPTDQVTQLYGATIPTPANGQSIRWNTALNAGAGGWENFTAGTASAVVSVSSANTDIAVANGSTTPQLTLNSGTSANQIVKLDGTAKLPGVDGSALTNVNAVKVGGTAVSLASLTSGQVLKYNGTNWVNAADSDALGGLSCASGRVAYYSGSAWACLEVTSVNTVNTIVSRDVSGVSNFGTVNTGTLKVNDGATGAISLITPVAVTSYTMRLPTSVGTSGYALTTDGGSPAQLSWSPMSSSQWTTSGSNIYYTTGNVGVGTSNPVAKFEVGGQIATIGAGGLLVDTPTATSQNIQFRDRVNGWNAAMITASKASGSNDNGTLLLRTTGHSISQLYLDAIGNVGVGTNAPTSSLSVVGANASGSNNAIDVLNVAGGTGGPSGGNGGSISLVAGSATAYQAGNGGSMTISAGSSSIAPGSVSLNSGGQSTGGGPSNITLSKVAGNNGGVVTLSGGNGGNGSGNGGSVSLFGGNGDSSVSTLGGDVNLTGGTGNGAAGVGGNVVINGGLKSGSGTNGNVLLANSRGNVAIGRSTASAKLDVQGQIVSRSFDNGSAVAFDMNNGNAQYTSASCGAMTMSNLVDGASYSLVVQGATSGTCTFTASGYTFRFNPANGPTTASSHTIYSMQVIGSIVYVSWITGF